MKIPLYFVFFILFFLIHSSAYGKRADCQKYRDKLENIKSKQRMGNTVKQSNKLKVKEEKTYKIWRKCEQGKLKKKKKKDNWLVPHD